MIQTKASAVPAQRSDRWTISELEYFPVEEGKRYEIVEGELLVSSQPHSSHQETCNNIAVELTLWARQTGNGRALPAPGVIFDPENAVAPDVVWVSSERWPLILGEDGKLHDAPDLAVEVLSPGDRNERRDREAKLKLYSVHGVREYWIADWRAKTLEIYRREGAALKLTATLYAEDELTSPLLPGFAVKVANLLPR